MTIPINRFYREHCLYALPMLGWFLFSALLSSYNKYVFGSSHMAFPCPLLLTSVHFFTQWMVAYSLSTLFPLSLGGSQVSSMSWKLFLSISIPCGLVTSGDVGLSNLALVRISITFYTMVKASSPIFVVLSAYAFGIVKITYTLILVVLVISAGELLTVVGEGVKFDALGFSYCVGAAMLSGMRWTVVQLKLQSLEPKIQSTIATMRVLSPVMFFSMILLSLSLEQPWIKLNATDGEGNAYFGTVLQGMITLGLGLVGACLAVAMILCEFYLIIKSNAIVLMIGGVVKEMITIMVGVTGFHDSINMVNIMGFVIVFLGVILYKVGLYLEKMEAEATEAISTFTDFENSNEERKMDTLHPTNQYARVDDGNILLDHCVTLRYEENGYHDNAFVITDDDDDDDLAESSISPQQLRTEGIIV